MNKNMQIPESFITDVYRLIWSLEDAELSEECIALCRSLDAQIKAKMERMERRNTFTKYKTAAIGSDEREEARNRYLDLAGIHREWRSAKEKSFLPAE